VRVHAEHNVPYQQRTCIRCPAEAVDSVHHLLCECEHGDLHALRLAQLHILGPQSSVKQLMALTYDASRVESLASYIHEVMHIAQADQ
jgi:hypothetical protein